MHVYCFDVQEAPLYEFSVFRADAAAMNCRLVKSFVFISDPFTWRSLQTWH